MTINYVPSFREMTLKIISHKFNGDIPREAELDNMLTDRLLEIRNWEPDILITNNDLQQIKDIDWEETVNA